MSKTLGRIRMGLSHFSSTFLVDDLSPLNKTLKQFWEIEELTDVMPDDCMTTEEKTALKMVDQSLNYVNSRYQVAMPWKDDPSKLPNNYDVAQR